MNTSTLTPDLPETETAAAPIVAQARTPIHTVVLPIALVALDIETREGYLSDDLATICAAAGKTGEAVLIASAGFPLETRQSSFAIWRKRSLEKLAVVCPVVRIFLEAHPALSAEFEAATIDLLNLDRLIHNQQTEKQLQRQQQLASQKDTLRKALSKNCEGIDLGRLPTLLVIRGDGAMKLLKSHRAGKDWGAIGGLGFYLLPLSTKDLKMFLPEE